MIVGRILGWLLILCALMALGAELVRYFDTGHYRVLVAGKLWFDIDRSSLNLTQAVVQRYVHPALWDNFFAPALLLPAWAVFGIPGLLLAVACRRRPTGSVPEGLTNG